MGLVAAMAWCQDCKWTAESRNAMGIAAIHHNKTGHYVIVETHLATKISKRKGEKDERLAKKEVGHS